MPVYAYESHMGGIYFSRYEYDIDDLYCEQCGDCDWLIGEAYDAKDMIAKLADYLVVESADGGYDLGEVLEDMVGYFNNIPSLEEAKQIALDNREKWEE